ncbi:MAG TPA: FkbM family methyltransferase [Candidatus Saccharimonadales bacterium]|nr:FkbM family methyltransferase [Candidatus Saccharimonadales bacterium]
MVTLPWGLPLEVDTSEFIGAVVADCGIYDISVVEAVFRLVDPTDRFVDFGANIGYVSAAAVAAGAGSVLAFEPHPEIFPHLARNRALWVEACPGLKDRITVRQQAVSSEIGQAVLRIPESEFSRNHGVSSLEGGPGSEDESFREIVVPTTCLDKVVELEAQPIGVLKVDIEGHELAVFGAGRDSLERGKVRDIIFEDPNGMDSPVARLLRASKYEVVGLNKTPFGPSLLDAKAYDSWFYRASRCGNLLATRDLRRAQDRMRPRGFRCLHPQNALVH